jgi:hypothetical protein
MKYYSMTNLDKNKLYKVSFTKGITWNPLSLLGGAIRLIADIDYNHTGVLYYINNNWYIQEAIDEGVKSDIFENSNAYHYYTDYIIEEPKFEYNYDECIKKIFEIEGKKYDFKGLLFYQFWLNIFNKWVGKASRDKDRFYCYESVAYIFNINEKKPKDINSKFTIIKKNKII